jgi:hypothetical protein
MRKVTEDRQRIRRGSGDRRTRVEWWRRRRGGVGKAPVRLQQRDNYGQYSTRQLENFDESTTPSRLSTWAALGSDRPAAPLKSGPYSCRWLLRSAAGQEKNWFNEAKLGSRRPARPVFCNQASLAGLRKRSAMRGQGLRERQLGSGQNTLAALEAWLHACGVYFRLHPPLLPPIFAAELPDYYFRLQQLFLHFSSSVSCASAPAGPG